MKNYKTNKALFSLVLLSMLIQMFAVSPFTNVKADSSNQIVKDLEIVGKKDSYLPGNIIKIEGKWALPDDSPEKEWKAGDQFSISIPEGLDFGGGLINLGEYGTGIVEGNKIVFTFSEEIEQKVNRNGGFYLNFKVLEPTDEGVNDLPLDFLD